MNQPEPSEEENPYRPPASPAAPEAGHNSLLPFEHDSLEEQRLTHAEHEASVKAVGIYFYVVGIVSLIEAVITVASPRFTQAVAARLAETPFSAATIKTIVLIASSCFGALFFLVGFYLRRLQNWARWVALVLMGFAILGNIRVLALVQSNPQLLGESPSFEWIRLGFFTLFLFYVVWILSSSNSVFIFTSLYRSIVARTPQIRPRTCVRDRIFFGVLICLYLLSIVKGLME